MGNWHTVRELEAKTTPISYEKATELMNSENYEKIQNTPKNLHSTCSIRLDEKQGGIFMWSGGMQRYYLIAKLKSKDLFSTPELLPANIQAILGNYETDCLSYADCQKMLAEMESFGYTFEFGLDAVPFNLRKLPNHE